MRAAHLPRASPRICESGLIASRQLAELHARGFRRADGRLERERATDLYLSWLSKASRRNRIVIACKPTRRNINMWLRA